MGRPGLTQNKKFRRLAMTIGGKAISRGYLELMWDSAYEAGDEVLGDSVDVELAAEWQGEAGKLTEALLASGFIELVESVYQIHDFWHHAPAYVRKRRTRENERRSKVDPCKSTDQSVTSQEPVTDYKTAPLPHPHPHPKEKEVPPLAPKGAPAEPASQGKTKRTPRKPLQSDDCRPDVLPHVQAVYKLVPKMHPVSGEEVHKGPFATAARAIQRLVDDQALTPQEAEWVGKVYYTAEELEAEFPEAMRGIVQAVSNAWDTRPKAMMQVSTLFGPEKKPWAQLLPVARKAMARVPVLLEVAI